MNVILVDDEQLEESYLALMKSYDQLNDPASVHKQFNHLKEILWKEVGVLPSAEISAWYDQWMKERIIL